MLVEMTLVSRLSQDWGDVLAELCLKVLKFNIKVLDCRKKRELTASSGQSPAQLAVYLISGFSLST